MPGFGYSIEQLRSLVENYSYPPDLGPYHELGGLKGIAAGVGTDLKDGLGVEEAAKGYVDRIEQYGDNTFPEPPHKGFFEMFFESFEDTTIMILVCSATVSLVLGITIGPSDEGSSSDFGWIEGVAIFVAVLIVALVSSVNNYQKELQFRKLNDVKNDKSVKVIRGGKELELSIYAILVGDVVKLETGDAIPADGLFISGHDLKTDESSMTGETHEIKKDSTAPLLLSGTQVSAGVGLMLVTAVGEHSEWGLTMSHLQEEPDPTPLQNKLEDVAATIGKFGLGVACLTFVVLVISWAIPIGLASSRGVPFDVNSLRSFVDFIIIAVTIVVLAVPEGMPLAVTISLAYSMKQMMKEKNLVRHLEACETMGGATNICSDKTGTLTENRMTVVDAWINCQSFERAPTTNDMSPEFLKLLVDAMCVNGSAFLQKKHVEDLEGGEEKERSVTVTVEDEQVDIMTLDRNLIRVVGNKTEGALILLARDLGFNYTTVRAANPLFRIWPFSSELKRMSVVIRTPTGYRLFCKGASEDVSRDCSHYMNAAGQVTPISDSERSGIAASINAMASRGLRTLSVAYRDLPENYLWEDDERAPDSSNLVLLTVVGIKDPVRPAVPGAVRRCKDAGITVRMVTGDNPVTATFIAKECKILDMEAGDTEENCVMEGPKFRKLPRRELDAKLKTLRVLARSSPTDKRLLVSRLRELGEVVAVTGDGTNDAPALKVADVGLSMGIAGTEVAKEASDIVILDDNFASIVVAVRWGRGVYDSIRKFVQFQLTVNIVALLTVFIGALSQRGTPLTAVQLLWLNLIMDTLGALALCTETPEEELLKRKPYGRHDRIISATMWRNIAFMSFYQLGLIFVLLYLGPYIFSTDLLVETSRFHYTIIFNVFVFCQIFNMFNCRKVNANELSIFTNLTGSLTFIGILMTTVGCQILMITFASSFVQTIPLSIAYWGITIGIAASVFIVGAVIRFLPVPRLAPPQPDADDKKPSAAETELETESDSDTDDEATHAERTLLKTGLGHSKGASGHRPAIPALAAPSL